MFYEKGTAFSLDTLSFRGHNFHDQWLSSRSRDYLLFGNRNWSIFIYRSKAIARITVREKK